MDFCNLTGCVVTFTVAGNIRKVKPAGKVLRMDDGSLNIKLPDGRILPLDYWDHQDWVTLVTKEVKKQLRNNGTHGRFVVPVNEISPGVYTSIDWGIPQ